MSRLFKVVLFSTVAASLAVIASCIPAESNCKPVTDQVAADILTGFYSPPNGEIKGVRPLFCLTSLFLAV
jgi:hypothetical protein